MNYHYFFHIPKTAGSSLNRIIESEFSQTEIFPPHLWSQAISYTPESLKNYRFFRGHFYSSFYAFANLPLLSFTFLRDPIERALSHFGHVVNAKEHYFHNAAIELGGIGAYLRDPLLSTTISNFQAKCLVYDKDPLSIAETLSDQALIDLELEKTIESHDPCLNDQELFTQAYQRLRDFEFFGMTEAFAVSVNAMRSLFGWTSPFRPATENVNSNRIRSHELDKQDLQALIKANAVDIELYQCASRLFGKRV